MSYGTLLDVHSVVADEALSRLWRQKQLEYTWLRALMERYEDFWDVTEAALRAACAQLKIAASEERIETLMQAYLELPAAFADARVALERYKGSRMAILSNGSSKMLRASIRHNGLEPYFESISVERVKTYRKPVAEGLRAGAGGAEETPASDILFVSSNAWDAAGAMAYGYRVCWCSRAGGELGRLGFAADMTVTRLDEMEAS